MATPVVSVAIATAFLTSTMPVPVGRPGTRLTGNAKTR